MIASDHSPTAASASVTCPTSPSTAMPVSVHSVHTALHSSPPLTSSPPSASSSYSSEFAYPPFGTHSRTVSSASSTTSNLPYLPNLTWVDRSTTQSSTPGSSSSVAWPTNMSSAASAQSVDSIDSLSACRISSSPSLLPSSSISISVSSPSTGILTHSAQQPHVHPTAVGGSMNLISPTSANKRKQQDSNKPNPKLSPPSPSTAVNHTAASSYATSPTQPVESSDGVGKKAKMSAAGQLLSSPFKVPQSRAPSQQSIPEQLTLDLPGLSRSSSSPALNSAPPAFHSPTPANGKRKKQHKRLPSGTYYPLPSGHTPTSTTITSHMSTMTVNSYSPPPPTTAPTSPTPPSSVSSHNSSSSSISSSQSSSPRDNLNPTTSPTSTAATNTYLAAGQLDIFERVNEIMKRDHVRQRQIAKMMNISCSTLSPMLKGKYKHTKLKHVEQLRNWCYQRDVKLWRKVAYYADAAALNEETLATTCGMNVVYFKQWLTFTLPLKYRLPFDQTLSEWVQSLGSDVTPYEEKNDRLGELGRGGLDRDDLAGSMEDSGKVRTKRKTKRSPQQPRKQAASDDKENKPEKERVKQEPQPVEEQPEDEELEDEVAGAADDLDTEDDTQKPADDLEFSVSAGSSFSRMGVPAPLLPVTVSEAMGGESALQFSPLELARMQGMSHIVEAAKPSSANSSPVISFASRLPTDVSEQERLFKAQQDLIASQQQQLEILTRMCAEKNNTAAAAAVAVAQQQQQQQQQQSRQFALQQQMSMLQERDHLASPRSAPPVISSPTHSGNSSPFSVHSHRISPPTAARSALAAAHARRAQVAHAVAMFAQSQAEAQVKAMLGLDNFTEEDEETLKEIQHAEMQAAKQQAQAQLATHMRAGSAAGVFFDGSAAAQHTYASPATSQPPPLTPASDASSIYSSSTTPVPRRHLPMAAAQSTAFSFMSRGSSKQAGMYNTDETNLARSTSMDLSASFASALGQQHWSDNSLPILTSPALSSSSSHSLSPLPSNHHEGGGETSMASFLLSRLPGASTANSPTPSPAANSPSASHPSDMQVGEFFTDEWQDAVHHQQQQQQMRGDMDEYDHVEDDVMMGCTTGQRLQLMEHTSAAASRSRLY